MDIERDYNRFRQIVRGKIKQDLKKYISRGELIGKKGKDFVSIPIPQIDMPGFRFGRRNSGGVGQGDNEEGDAVFVGEPEDFEDGEAGDAPGEHILEVDFTMEELAQILAEELELPRIKPKGKDEIQSSKSRYTSERRTGPESLRRFRSIYRRALKRLAASGLLNPENPEITYIQDDKRYLSWKEKPKPESNAIIVYMMDVSGSMGDEQKEMVRIEAFWIDTWIKNNYRNVKVRYIIHDAVAQEVDEDIFYYTRESGGTVISSAYELLIKLIEDEFPPEFWNIYAFHFSDGDNFSEEDNSLCVQLLKTKILPAVNLFGYGQVESTYGSGQFIRELDNNLKGIDNLIISKIESRDDIYKSIRDFLGKGK